MSFEFKEFPKWMYHKKEAAKIIKSDKELKALGKDWFHNPSLKVEPKRVNREMPKPVYNKVEFPKWVYDKDKNSFLVKTEAEYKKLDKKWLVEKIKKEVKKDNPPQVKVTKPQVIKETVLEEKPKVKAAVVKEDENPFNK